jgi:hypothetical protein
MGSVVVSLGDGSTLEAGGRASGSTLGAGAGSMGVGILGDCSLVKVMRRGLAWKVGLGGGCKWGAEYGDVVGK